MERGGGGGVKQKICETETSLNITTRSHNTRKHTHIQKMAKWPNTEANFVGPNLLFILNVVDWITS